jgi:exonuclease III
MGATCPSSLPNLSRAEPWQRGGAGSYPSPVRLGLVDLLRVHTNQSGIHTWWDYRAGSFRAGVCLDLILAACPAAELMQEVRVDRNERRLTAGEGKPSDHAPVIAELTAVASHR